MELEFIKKGNIYEAIFEVPSDFNIHIELNKPSYLGVYQSSIQNGEYSFATEYKLNNIQKVYDIDFGALVYPKYIKVVSGSEVVSASVNFNEGGGSGSGSSSGESIVKYYEVNASANSNIALREIFPFQKGTDPNGNLAIGGFLGVSNAVAVAFMPVYFNLNGELKKFMTPEDVNEAGIMDIPEGFIIKEISQDEFYNLEA